MGSRKVEAEVKETIAVSDKHALKHKRSGRKKPLYEAVSGDDFHRKTGRWNKLTREIDRENNRYKECVVDKDGEVVHQCDEPLTKHVGHGSARSKQKQKKQ